MSTVVDPNVKDARDNEFTHIPEEKSGESKFQYPGIPVTCDGAAAVVHVETAVCHGSGAIRSPVRRRWVRGLITPFITETPTYGVIR